MLEKDIQKYFPQKVFQTTKITHSGNNTLFRVDSETGAYVLKQYFDHYEQWSRGISEFNALSFLWNQEFRNVPKPIVFHEKDNIGVYGFIDGTIVPGKEVNEEDIVAAANFLARLHSLGEEGKRQFGPASSACLSLRDYIRVIDRRYARVSGFVKDTTPQQTRKFVLEDVGRKIQSIKKRFERDSEGLDLDKELSIEQQVLTPADFGFHNILKNGLKYSFIDFEYFGRDDPARQVLDFIHHGSSRYISQEMKELFVHEYLSGVNPAQKPSRERLELLDDLTEMTWVLICLNALNTDFNVHLDNRTEVAQNRIKEAQERLGGIE